MEGAELPRASVRRLVLENGRPVDVSVDCKAVSRIRLKVLPPGTVRVSVPPDTPAEYLDALLESRRGWIGNRIRLFRETRPVDREDGIRTGTATRILGRQLQVLVVRGGKKEIRREDRLLVVETPFADDREALDRQFRDWWRKSARAHFLATLDRLYPIVGRHGVARPALRVVRMKTLWGSCGRATGRINLNEWLYKAPCDCIDYVILHELLHFLHPAHDRAFRTALAVHMPDWQKRQGILDREIVQGF